MQIKKELENEIARWEAFGHPALMQRFVLRNGQQFKAQKFHGKRLKAKECFRNAWVIGTGTYCEGYAMSPLLPMLIHHAWRVTDDGRVLDPTWEEPERCQYFGVKIPDEELEKELLKNKMFGILDTGFGLNSDFIFDKDPELKSEMIKIRMIDK